MYWASLVAQLVKNLPAVQETWVWSLGWEDPLAEGKATHSSILVRRIRVQYCTVHGVAKNRTWSNDFHFHFKCINSTNFYFIFINSHSISNLLSRYYCTHIIIWLYIISIWDMYIIILYLTFKPFRQIDNLGNLYFA